MSEVNKPTAGLFALARSMFSRIRDGDGIGARLARGSAAAFAIHVVGALVAFGVQIILARGLGAASYGAYLVVVGWMNWGSLVARFQFDGVATRYVSEYRATGQLTLLRGFVRFSHRWVGVASLGIASLAIAIALLTDLIPAERRWMVVAAAVLMIPNTILNVTSASIEGLQRMVASQAATMLIRPGLLGLAALGLFFFARENFTATTAIWLNAGACTCAVLYALFYLRSGIRSEGTSASVEMSSKPWINTALGFWWVTVAQQALTPQTDVLVVGALLSEEQAGFYGSASQLAMLVIFGVNAVSALGAPMIAQLYAQKKYPELERLITHYGRLNALATVPIFLGMIAFGNLILKAYGKDFEFAYPVLVILSLTQVVRAVFGTQAGYLLTMTGRERLAGRYVGYSALINLVFTLILTPVMGITGTALATLIATAARSIILIRYVRKEFGIDVTGFARIARSRPIA